MLPYHLESQPGTAIPPFPGPGQAAIGFLSARAGTRFTKPPRFFSRGGVFDGGTFFPDVDTVQIIELGMLYQSI
eukprot:333458-Hanusia_phi.AAC.2